MSFIVAVPICETYELHPTIAGSHLVIVFANDLNNLVMLAKTIIRWFNLGIHADEPSETRPRLVVTQKWNLYGREKYKEIQLRA